MNLVRSLGSGLLYQGEVEGKRQTYYVFKARRDFMILSFSKRKPNSGNFNIVDGLAVTYVKNKFLGAQAITSREVYKRSKKPQYIDSSLAALNILYVLVTMKQARIDHRFKSPEIFFNLR
jgi:hypothetical protein